MPSISGTFDPRTKQIIIQCGIIKSGFIRDLKSQQSNRNKIPIKVYNSLIDTGANITAISSKIVEDLSLQHHSITQQLTANGPVVANVYDVDLILGFGNQGIPIEKINVISANLDGHFDILLGMDIILRGHLSISHDHHFTFSI